MSVDVQERKKIEFFFWMHGKSHKRHQGNSKSVQIIRGAKVINGCNCLSLTETWIEWFNFYNVIISIKLCSIYCRTLIRVDKIKLIIRFLIPFAISKILPYSKNFLVSEDDFLVMDVPSEC